MAGTDKTIRQLLAKSRAQGTRIEGPHPAAEGLRLRVNAASGAVSWIWFGPRDASGKRRLHVLGASPAVGALEAAERLARLKVQYQRRLAGLPAQVGRPQPVHLTLRQLLARFAWLELRHRRVRREPIRNLRRHFIDVVGDVEVRALEPDDVVRVLERLLKQNKPAQARKVFALAKQLLRYAAGPRVRAIAVSPAQNLSLTDFKIRPAPRRRRLGPDEMGALWRLLHGAPRDPRAETSQLALLVLLGTARRTGELVKAKKRDFDLDAGVWWIPPENRKMTRRAEQRASTDVVRLPAQVVRALVRLFELHPSSPWALGSPRDSSSGHIGDTTLSRALRDLQRLGHVRLHGRTSPHFFRHAFRSTVEERRWASVTAAELALGHVLPGILAIYNVGTFDEERSTALQRWCDYLDGVANIDVTRGSGATTYAATDRRPSVLPSPPSSARSG
jgi:integrase